MQKKIIHHQLNVLNQGYENINTKMQTYILEPHTLKMPHPWEQLLMVKYN